MKEILALPDTPRGHWVGDGFAVRSLFGYNELGQRLSPFLLLDYASPAAFAPTDKQLGVGWHPHRGFETVTIVYQGELEHRDSTGAGGIIGPGDVQWMTAGAGILHEEFHSTTFRQSGGTLQMVQLWVNLPAKHKTAAPSYQTLRNTDIPTVRLPDGGELRVIAGEYAGHLGPAHTFSPVDVWDLALAKDRRATLRFAEGRTAAIVVLEGVVQVDDGRVVRGTHLVVLDRREGEVTLEANNDARVLILSGEPLNEPVVGWGPFVMNTKAEIQTAIEDFNGGRFGTSAVSQ